MDTDYDYKEAMKLDNQLCFPLYAAARAVTGLYTPWLKELGLTYTQYLVFLVLWERDHIPAGEICSRLHLDTGTISPLLKKMEKAGHIRKERSSEDDRVVLISLTERGYVKRVAASAFRSQSRGGRGVMGHTTKDEDEVVALIPARSL
ncbi:MAG: MarR family transcriptional regulator, partial [Eubacterium sp.]|nr:MarR family transcriptional regulator [Eubacterium sp.]